MGSLVDKSRRRSQTVGPRPLKGRGTVNALVYPRTHLAPHTFVHVGADQLPGYQTTRLHDFIRKQEGTEIFDGRKDHVNRLVMHYVELQRYSQQQTMERPLTREVP